MGNIFHNTCKTKSFVKYVVNTIKYRNLMDSLGYHGKAYFGPKNAPQKFDFFEQFDLSPTFLILCYQLPIVQYK
jgi:hypothetical protein